MGLKQKLYKINLFDKFVQKEMIAKASAEMVMEHEKGVVASWLYILGTLAVFIILIGYNAVVEKVRLVQVPAASTDTQPPITFAEYQKIITDGHDPICPCQNPTVKLFGTFKRGKLIKDSKFATETTTINPVCTDAANMLGNCTAWKAANSWSASEKKMCGKTKPYIGGINALCTLSKDLSKQAVLKAMRTQLITPTLVTKSVLTERVEDTFNDVREGMVRAFATPLASIDVVNGVERPVTSVLLGYMDAESDPEKGPRENAGNAIDDPNPVPIKMLEAGRAYEFVNTGATPPATCNCFKDSSCSQEVTFIPAADSPNKKDSKLTVKCSEFATLLSFPMELFSTKWRAALLKSMQRRLKAVELGIDEEAAMAMDYDHEQGRFLQGGSMPGSGSGGSGGGSYPSGGGSYPSGGGSYPSGGSAGGASGGTQYCDTAKKCDVNWLGDGICDSVCNNKECGYDFGWNTGHPDCGKYPDGGGSGGGPPAGYGGGSQGGPSAADLQECAPYCSGEVVGGSGEGEPNEGLVDNAKTTGPLKLAIAQAMLSKFGAVANHKNYFNACAPKQCTYTVVGKQDATTIATVVLGLLGGLSVFMKAFAEFIVTVLYFGKIKRAKKEREDREKAEAEAEAAAKEASLAEAARAEEEAAAVVAAAAGGAGTDGAATASAPADAEAIAVDGVKDESAPPS